MNSQAIPYTEDLCSFELIAFCNDYFHWFLDQQLGRNLARTFLDYYKSINYISWSPSCSVMPRLKEDRIKSRLPRQSLNMPIVNQDDAYEIKLVHWERNEREIRD